MREKMPVVNRQAGQRFQRAEIELLAHRLAGIVRPGADERREIFDFHNGVLGKQKFAKLPHVDPSIRGLTERPVVEIETVDIDVCCDECLQTCKSRPEGGFAPGHRSDRGDMSNI
jgi:hypothetical protein